MAAMTYSKPTQSECSSKCMVATDAAHPHACQRKRHSSGLTLIELLIAITVLAVVAVLGWRGLDSIVRSRVALTEEMERTRGIQLAFAQMERDCANVITPDMVSNRPPLAAGDGRLVLIRKILAENQPTRLQVVSYRINNGVLYRRESIPTRDLGDLDAAWLANASANAQQEVALETGVNAMSLRVWANNATAWRSLDINAPQLDSGITTSTVVNTATTTVTPTATSTALTGLEVSLQMERSSDAKMIKLFLLGSV
jgi:general secretion pathway protein J